MTEINLKPCPFCGGEAKFKSKSLFNYVDETWVECDSCAARSKSGLTMKRKPADSHFNIAAFDTETEIANFWNRRNEHGA